MFKDKLKFLKFFDNKDGKEKGALLNDKKKIENLVVFVIILIITIIAINMIWNDDKTNNSKRETNTYSKQLASNFR